MSEMYRCDTCGLFTTNHRIVTLPNNNIMHISECDKCQAELEAYMEWLNETTAIDEMICPWCEIPFEVKVYKEGIGEIRCPECDSYFEYEASRCWRYITRKPDYLYDDEVDDETMEFLERLSEEMERKLPPLA